MATIIHFDGREESIEPKNGTDFALEELQPIVSEGAPEGSNYIEIYSLKDGRIMVLNEEGKIIGLPKNDKATAIADLPTPEERAKIAAQYAAAGIPFIMTGFSDGPDYIAGTVLVCESKEVQ